MGELELRKATQQKAIWVPSERAVENVFQNALYSCYSKCGPQAGRAEKCIFLGISNLLNQKLWGGDPGDCHIFERQT